jgi:hypothetical protein
MRRRFSRRDSWFTGATDFRGTKKAGINYGMLFTARGVAGIRRPRIGGVLYDKYHNHQSKRSLDTRSE